MKKEYRSFKDARKFVHTLKLKNQKDWEDYRKSGSRPDDIPSGPLYTYRNNGWKDLGDWLGTGTIASQNRKYRTFDEARKFVQSLQLENDREWRKFYMSDARPPDIPTAPYITYRKEWKGIGYWLGNGKQQENPPLRDHRSFKEAREFVRSLGLKNMQEWQDYCKSGNKPDDIPSTPQNVYKKRKKKK